MSNSTSRRSWASSPLRAVFVYIVVSFLWVALSDYVVSTLVSDAWLRTQISIFKGWLYVSVTAVLVWWLVASGVRATENAVATERASERRLRDLLDRVELLAVMFGTDGRIVFASQGLLATTGHLEGELIGRDCFDELLDGAAARERWQLALADPDESDALRRPVEVELEVKGGELRTIRWVATLTRDAAGAIVGGAAVGEDVTERLRFEDELRQIQKMEALGRLAGSVAHDFNNLLTAISGYTDLVLTELDPEDLATEDVREIRRAADRASALTAQLLAFSRRRATQAGPIDLAATVASMAPMLQRLLGEQIELAVHGAGSCWVEGDPSQVEQALLNLAVNGRDAMAAGGRLSIEVGPADAALVRRRELLGARPGPHILLRVADTGPGIPPDALPHLFEPFFTTKPKGKGTGLGLAIVYGVAKAAGGQVWAENTAEGARFNLLLPECPSGTGAPAGAAAPLARGRGTEHVLVVEDDGAVRALVRTVLEREGYTVLEAAGGDEALAIVEGSPQLDVLVSDVVMPGMSGRELVTRLRSMRHDLRVLFISGYDEDPELIEIGERTLEAPLLRKPFTANELGEKVRALLDESAAPAEPSAAPASTAEPTLDAATAPGAPSRTARPPA